MLPIRTPAATVITFRLFTTLTLGTERLLHQGKHHPAYPMATPGVQGIRATQNL